MCIIAMLLAACGGNGATETPSSGPVATEPATLEKPTETQPEEPAQAQVTIRFAIFDWQQPIYEGLIKDFEEANPDLKVEIVSINEVLGVDLVTFEWPDDAGLRLASAADVGTVGVSRQDVQEGLVRDLTPFVEADPDFQTDDFYPNTLERHQWDGGTWAIPTTVNYLLIFYNKDAFDEAGVAYPEPGWSWDDFVVAAQSLTQREGDEVVMWGFVPSAAANRTLIESRVGLVIDDWVDPPEPRFDDEEVIDAVRWYAGLFLEEQVAPYFEPEDEDDDQLALSDEQTLIDNGQAAMWPEADAVWWYRSQQGNVGAVPFPVDTADSHSSPFGTDSLSMSAGTSQPQAAWRLIDFLSRQVLGGLGPGVQSLPARQSVAGASDYWDDLDAELADTLRFALDHSYEPRWITGHDAFTDALKVILSGEKSVEEALAEAQTAAEHEIQEKLTEEAGATPAPTIVVAPPEGEKPAAEGATTITFVPGLGSLNLEPYRDLANRFQEEHPDIVVEVKMADLMGGTVPDLANMAEASDCFQWYPSLYEAKYRDAILNLQPFLDADASFTTDDFYAPLLDQFSWQGQLWGLPADVTPYIIEYNRDLFDEAGLDYPAPGWTWDDFLESAVTLTKGEDDTKQYGYVAEAYELNDLLFMLERLGAKLIDENVDPPALTFNDPATVQSLEWYASLSTEHQVKPVFLTDIRKLLGATSAFLERQALITDGRAAMWTSTGTLAAVFGNWGDLNVGAAPLPSLEGAPKTGTYAGSSGYFISSQTEARQACWQWITFLTGQPMAVQGFPARRSAAESSEYRELVGAERADAYMDSVADADLPSSYQVFSEEEWMGGALFWLGQAYGQAVEGETTVQEALDAVQVLADDYRACLVVADDFSEETWQRCVKEVDPTLPDFVFGLDE